jgi:nucleotide-binding universal stress UspA family protein
MDVKSFDRTRGRTQYLRVRPLKHGDDMAIHTLLIHLNDRRRASRLIGVASAYASDNARMIGLHVFSAMPPVAPMVVPYGDNVIQSIEQTESREAAAIEAMFHELTASRGYQATWICERAAGPDLAHHVMQHGRGADLIVASAADADWEMAPVLDFPERLAMESGRPVLMVPNEGTFDVAPAHAVVAWNGSREAARAGFDTVALLGNTANMTVLVIEDEDGDEEPMASAARFADTVARHGVSVTVVRRPPAGRNVGEAIWAEVTTLGGDLLVMGAYGHSRVRELVFGGATRHVTHHLKLPTLLSH